MRRESPQSDQAECLPSDPGLDHFVAPTAAYLLAAIVMGGSSTMLAPSAGLDLLALPLLAAAVVRLAYRGVGADARWPLILAGLTILVPLVQLVPLPHGLWALLPGRAAVANALDLAQAPRGAMPISLAPDATWRSLFGLMPPLALFCAALSLPDRERRVLGACVALAALVSVALFVFQRFGGEGRVLFGVLDLGAANGASGFFANRNHQTTLLAVALPLAIAAIAGSPAADWRLTATTSVGIALVLIVGAIVTTSRAAFILAPIAAALGLAIALRRRAGRPMTWLGAAPLVALAGAVAFVVALGVAVNVPAVAERFDRTGGGELRVSLFPIVARAGLDFAPLGAGLGSFPAVYQAYEPASLVGPAFVNHAHNEVLEVWLEAGAPGLLLLAGFLGWVAWTGLRRDMRATPGEQATTAAGVAVVALILIHGLIDYPLRTPALATVFGLACALMVRPVEVLAADRTHRANLVRALGLATFVLPATAAVGWLCFHHAASSYYDQQDPVRALRWNPRNPQALASLAERDFGRSSEGAGARRSAQAASRQVLAVAPLDAGSYRRLGLLAEAGGEPALARSLMQASDRLSRRDELTQMWLMLDDLKRARFDGALLRADLIHRQWWQLESVVFPVLQESLGDPRLRAATVRMLAQSPEWRPGFLRTLAWDGATVGAAREIEGALRSTKSPPTEDETATLVTALVAKGLFAEARDEWAKAARVTVALGVYDGDFRGRPGGPPFNWRFAGSTAPMVLDDGGAALAARPSSEAGGLLAEQLLDLRPGAYRLKMESRAASMGDGVAESVFEWRLSCLNHEPSRLGNLAVAGLSSAWRTLAASFVVEPGCIGQRLQLYSVGAQNGGAAYFRDVVAEPEQPSS